MRTAPLINVWTMTTFLYPRFARVTLIFVSVYLHSLFCALFFQAIYGTPVLQTAAVVSGNLRGTDIGIVVLSNIFTGGIMYIFYALFKVSDVRIRISRTVRELDNMIFEIKREQKMKYFLAYFMTLCTIGVTFWYVVTFSAAFGWAMSFEWLWTLMLTVIWDAFLFDPLLVLVQILIQKQGVVGNIFAKIRGIKQIIPDF